MIFSGTLALDPAHHAACTDTLRTRLADLELRRRTTGTAVERVLASWHGEAADRFRSCWEDWDRGATLVVEHLARGVAALDRFRAEAVGADAASGGSSTHLLGRLG